MLRNENLHCEWCGRDISANKMGRRRKYCSQSCRQRAYEARHNLLQSNLPEDSVVLSQADADAIIDRIFQVRCGAEDLLIALEEDAPRSELQEMANALVKLAINAERLR